MTHAELSESLTRPPGCPPSQCKGELDLVSCLTDAAQEGEGPPGTLVAVNLYRCRKCRATLPVAIDGGVWRQRNEYVLA